jgi:hypothetical protein
MVRLRSIAATRNLWSTLGPRTPTVTSQIPTGAPRSQETQRAGIEAPTCADNRAATQAEIEEVCREWRDRVLDRVVDAVTTATQARLAYIHLLEPETNELVVRAHRGLRAPALELLNHSECQQLTPCANALETGRRSVAYGAVKKQMSVDAPALNYLFAKGGRAIQSTPLLGRLGVSIGVLSTHYRTRHELDIFALMMIDRAAQQASSIVEWYRNRFQRMANLPGSPESVKGH